MNETTASPRKPRTSVRRDAFTGGRLEGLSAAGEATRASLLRAAAEVFAAKGFAATSIDDVARRLGATKGLVYHHYRSKGDLYLDAMRWGIGSLDMAVLPAARSRERAATRLKRMAEAHVGTLLAEPAARHTRRGDLPEPLRREQPAEAEAIAALAAAYDDRFLKALQDARREGDADRRLSEPLALAVLLTILDLPARERPAGEPPELAFGALRACGLDAAILDEEFA